MTAYLDQPIYYPDSERFGTFSCENSARHDLSVQELLQSVAQMAMKAHGDTLLVWSVCLRNLTRRHYAATGERVAGPGWQSSFSVRAADGATHEDLAGSRIFDPRSWMRTYSLYLISQR